jgi:hypothetical protein
MCQVKDKLLNEDNEDTQKICIACSKFMASSYLQ